MQLVPVQDTGAVVSGPATPGPIVAQVIEMSVSLYSRRGYTVPWISYLALEGGEFVGSCGFAGPPHAGEAEIAYYTFPGNEGQGVATRMAIELLRLSKAARDQAGLGFIAHTLPEEGPSTSILRKLGFVFVGEILHPEDGRVWKWREHVPSEA